MAGAIPRLFTIAPDKPFLEVLATEVLKGFPCTDGKIPGKLDLAPIGYALGYSLIYGLGFVVIYMLHLTIATKQPAMTGLTGSSR